MTDFHVEIVKLGKIEKHPNADALDITFVHGETGYPCIVKKDSFKEGDLAVYIPVETCLPDRPEFAFLSSSERRRLRAKKLRGFFSMGLVIPVPADVPAVEGTDVAELLGITKFDPKQPSGHYSKIMGGDCEPNPEHFTFHRYTDIEPLRRNSVVLTEGEDVILTEKCHGSNYRAVHDGQRLWIGSRMQIKKPPAEDNEGAVWWRIAKELDLENKLARVPGHIFYGEVFGPGVQDLTYGQSKPTLRIFDVLDTTTNQYLDHDDVVRLTCVAGLELVPHLYRGPWKPKELLPLCEGKTTLGEGHCREGFVVKPVKERWDHRVGRVILKMVGEDYHMRKQKNVS
jgi:RNA ligase (TIGR02306 family)